MLRSLAAVPRESAWSSPRITGEVKGITIECRVGKQTASFDGFVLKSDVPWPKWAN